MKSLLKFNIIRLVVTVVFLFLAITISILALDKIKDASKVYAKESLQTVLQTTRNSFHIWIKQRKRLISNIAKDKALVELTKKLISEYLQQANLSKSITQQELRDWLKPTLEIYNDKGFFIISKDRVSIASTRDRNIGTTNLIHQQRKDYLNLVFNGETQFIPTIRSDVQLTELESAINQNPPTIFVASPIKNEKGEVIAALAIRIDASGQFTQIAQQGRLGDTGETYAFDENSILITESRFDNQLNRIGLVPPDGKGILSIRIADPGGNLLEGYMPKTPKYEWPLTLMANNAINGNLQYHIDGYRDYRGITVIGAWIWDDELGFGLTTEIDINEALQPYYGTRLILIALLTITIILSMILLIIMERLQIKSKKELLASHALMEEEVFKRTSDLNQAKDDLTLLNKELEILATTDELTNISNRRYFNEKLDSEWRRNERDKGSLSILFLDIDCFKKYNDTYGHQMGDDCLLRVANYLMGSEIAKRPGDIIARYGGEEFIIVLSNSNQADALKIAEIINRGIYDLQIPHSTSDVAECEVVTVSIGVNFCSNLKKKKPSALIKEADTALYNAKHKGRNQSCLFSESSSKHKKDSLP